MNDAINHLKMAAADYRRLTTPNQFTITEAAARENERLANQFEMAAEALRQMHNRLFVEGIVAGVKSIADSCNARRLRKASPASAPVAAPYYRIAERGFRWDAENRQHIPQLLIEFTPVPANAPNDSNGWKDRDKLAGMLATAPTPPSTEDRWQPIATAPKNEFVLLAGPSGYTTIETVFATGRMCSDYHVGRWIDHANDDLTDWGFEPTHWMPLPKAPTMQEDKKP